MPEEEEETCHPCVEATAISFYNDQLKKIVGRTPSKILLNGVTSDRITTKEYFETAKRIIKKHGKTEHQKAMKEIDAFIQENLNGETL